MDTALATVTRGTNEERSRSGSCLQLVAEQPVLPRIAAFRQAREDMGDGRPSCGVPPGAARSRGWRTRLPGSRGLWEHPRAAAPWPHGWRLPRTRFPSWGEGGGSRSPRALAPPPLLRAPKGRVPGHRWPRGKKHCALPGRRQGGEQTAPARLRSPAGGRCGGRSRGSAPSAAARGRARPGPRLRRARAGAAGKACSSGAIG